MKTSLQQLLEYHGDGQSKLTLQTITVDRRDNDEDGDSFIQKYILVEGDQQSLHLLGSILIAFANGDLGDTFDLHPHGAGAAHLSEGSDIGIYLRKLHMSGLQPLALLPLT